jgi:hypothetical protein
LPASVNHISQRHCALPAQLRWFGPPALMAPEAYTLKSAIDGWILHESNDQIRERAAVAYDKYQRCGLKGARRLLVTGW